jgi:hypothetical protein
MGKVKQAKKKKKKEKIKREKKVTASISDQELLKPVFLLHISLVTPISCSLLFMVFYLCE